jgi:Protein of unknown function (DUF3305)
MTTLHFGVDVLMERVPLVNRWVSEQWRPAAVVPLAESGGRGVGGAPVRVTDGPAGTTWRFPAREIELHTSEAEGYYLNITSDTPMVFVMWRPAEDGSEPAALPERVTVSYNQAGRFMDAGEKVDTVPMPDAILAWMHPFVAEHYKPEPRRKVKRNDPFKDGAFVRDRPPRG